MQAKFTSPMVASIDYRSCSLFEIELAIVNHFLQNLDLLRRSLKGKSVQRLMKHSLLISLVLVVDLISLLYLLMEQQVSSHPLSWDIKIPHVCS